MRNTRPTLTLLHTAAVHVETFDRLAAEIAPDIRLRHIVDASLLREARDHGLTDSLVQRVGAAVVDAKRGGAKVVLCTCSTIGGCAEAAAAAAGCAVLRLDRPMAEQAVASGPRILVVAALASTLAPTRELIESIALARHAAVRIYESVCADAWASFERGDMEEYFALIGAAVRAASQSADVVVLAQGSMAGALPRCGDLRIPILTSPRLGFAAAVRLYRA